MHHLPSRYIPCDGRLTASAYFKSTLPAWGATQSAWPSSCAQTFQSTLPAGGATPPRRLRRRRKQNFNPRSPWGERLSRLLFPSPSLRFQSTLPVGGATHPPQLQQVSGHISIHAPRIGSDSRINSTASSSCYFNPRSPHGERHQFHGLPGQSGYFNPRSPHGERPSICTVSSHAFLFQSTLPAWGATRRKSMPHGHA